MIKECFDCDPCSSSDDEEPAIDVTNILYNIICNTVIPSNDSIPGTDLVKADFFVCSE